MTGKSYGVVTPEILKDFDGLGFLQAIIAGTQPQPPIAKCWGAHATTTCMIFPTNA